MLGRQNHHEAVPPLSLHTGAVPLRSFEMHVMPHSPLSAMDVQATGDAADVSSVQQAMSASQPAERISARGDRGRGIFMPCDAADLDSGSHAREGVAVPGGRNGMIRGKAGRLQPDS